MWIGYKFLNTLFCELNETKYQSVPQLFGAPSRMKHLTVIKLIHYASIRNERNLEFIFILNFIDIFWIDFQQRWLFMKKSTASTTTTETLQEISTQLITYCTNSCLENPFCVATIFSRNMRKCLLQRRSSSGIPMTVETNSELYEVQFDSSFRKKCK